jgi:uncharacterized protein (DUF2235 family)
VVASARHAVAIDEHRRSFPPTPWGNLDALNAGLPARPYRQAWFPGDHGSVGGGGAVTGLAVDALAWVAEGAEAAGLALDPAQVAEWGRARDCLAPLASRGSRARAGLLDRLLALGPVEREGPLAARDLAPAAVARWRRDPGYRPLALRRLAGALHAAA